MGRVQLLLSKQKQQPLKRTLEGKRKLKTKNCESLKVRLSCKANCLKLRKMQRECGWKQSLNSRKKRSISQKAYKTRLLEAEAIRLEVEVQALEFEECGQESLKQRLKDFEETDPIPLDNAIVLPTNGSPNAYTSTPKQPTEPQQLKVKFGNQEVTTNGDPLSDPIGSTIVLRSSLDSLPKLKLDTFDGDLIKWNDWISMFRPIIDDAEISNNAKMQHLQNAVTGRAKDAIEGSGYSGELYAEALQKLESRFGKPYVVVKPHLNCPQPSFTSDFRFRGRTGKSPLVYSTFAPIMGVYTRQENTRLLKQVVDHLWCYVPWEIKGITSYKVAPSSKHCLSKID